MPVAGGGARADEDGDDAEDVLADAEFVDDADLADGADGVEAAAGAESAGSTAGVDALVRAEVAAGAAGAGTGAGVGALVRAEAAELGAGAAGAGTAAGVDAPAWPEAAAGAEGAGAAAGVDAPARSEAAAGAEGAGPAPGPGPSVDESGPASAPPPFSVGGAAAAGAASGPSQGVGSVGAGGVAASGRDAAPDTGDQGPAPLPAPSPAPASAAPAWARRAALGRAGGSPAGAVSGLGPDDGPAPFVGRAPPEVPRLSAVSVDDLLRRGRTGPVETVAPPAAPPAASGPAADPDDEKTFIGGIGAELVAALGKPRARGVGPPDAAAPVPPPAPSVAVGRSRVAPASDATTVGEGAGALRLIEPSRAPRETPGAAAIQILGVGKARTVSQTVELGDDAPSYGGAEPSGGGGLDDESASLSVAFEAPAPAVRRRAPVLTDTTASAGPKVTVDGLVGSTQSRGSDADARAFLEAARAAELRGDFAAAELSFGDLISVDGGRPEGWLGRGRCRVELGDYAAAMSDFQRAEDCAAGSVEPLVEIGNLFYVRKEYRKAIATFDQAVEQDPKHARAYCLRGLCHAQRKSHQQAADDLRRAAQLDPTLPNIERFVQAADRAADARRR
jgi:hypothetical protein